MRFVLLLATVLVICALLAPPAKAQIPNVQISTPTTRLQNEEQVFFCPVDSSIVLATWRDFRLGYRRCAIGRSTDGGVTWTDHLNDLLLDYDYWESDPTMTVDAQGNFICSFLDFSATVPGDDSSWITFIRSTDKGLTWQGPYPVVPPAGPYFEDKQFITCDRTGGTHDGNIYVAWARFPNPTRMMFARSLDGGVTFDDTIIVGPPQYHEPCGYTIDAGQFAQPLVGADGSVYVFWRGTELIPDDCAGYASLKMSKSTDGGVTWPIIGEPVFRFNYFGEVEGNIAVYNAPAGDVDLTGGPYNGNMYISSVNGLEDGEYYHADIVLIKSTDGGDTWMPPVRVNDDPLGVNVDQFHPWLVVNQTGVIVMIFYDQRMDPNHYDFDVFAAYSFDGGETVTANHRLSEVSSSPDYLDKSSFTGADDVWDGLFDDKGEYHLQSTTAGRIGEYIGVTAYNDYIVAVWTDTRNGNSDVYGAYYTLPFLAPRLYGVPDNGYMGVADDSLYWSTCWHEGDVSYRVEIDDDPAFGSPELVDIKTDNKLYSTEMSLSEGLYYWRVKAFRTAELDSTDYSDVWSFTVDTDIPALATLVSPIDGDTLIDPMPEFVWSVPGISDFFDLEIAGDIDFSGMAPYFIYTGLTGTSYPMPESLTIYTDYFWRVRHYDAAGNSAGFVVDSFTFVEYICGDVNRDGAANVGDAVYLISWIFKGGPAPEPLESGDVNLDGQPNVGDAVYLINYIFKSGPPPCQLE